MSAAASRGALRVRAWDTPPLYRFVLRARRRAGQTRDGRSRSIGNGRREEGTEPPSIGEDQAECEADHADDEGTEDGGPQTGDMETEVELIGEDRGQQQHDSVDEQRDEPQREDEEGECEE